MGPIELFERCNIREPSFSFCESSNLDFFYSKKRKNGLTTKKKGLNFNLCNNLQYKISVSYSN